MKRQLIIALTLAALTAPVGAAAVAAPQETASESGGTSILPGYWEYSAKLFGVGKLQRKCLQRDEVEDFLTRPCNRHYTCVYPTKQVGGGKLKLDGYWQNKEGKRATVHASGDYRPKSFNIKANGKAIGGIPFVASMDAKWLAAECPAGEQASK